MRPCDPNRGVRNWGCSWYGEEHLEYMITQQVQVHGTDSGTDGHNELVLDVRPWVRHLPGTIEAFFVLPYSKAADIDRVRSVRNDFLSHYQLEPEMAVPILLFDPKGERTLRPFSLYAGGW